MKKIKKTLSVTLLMLGLVSVGAGAGFVAKNAVVEPVAARAEIYPDWTCAVNKISATSDSTSSVIYGEVVDGAVDEIDEETLFTLHEGSGAGFALNGEAFTPVSVMAPATNVVRIDLGFEAQAGDVVTVSGAFSNADWEMTIEFNNCALQFDGSAWVAVGGSETPDVPEVNDNVSDLGAVASAAVGSTTNQVYLAFASGVALPIDSWDYAFSYVSGNGITVNDTMISMVNSVKSVGNKFFVNLGAEAVEGDVLKIGGTFACESQGVQYVIADSEFVWNGSAWVSTAEPETPPVAGYTTHDIGALTLHVNSTVGGASGNNNQLYLTRADEEALPILSWEYAFAVGEGGYFKINDEVVTPNAIKSTGDGFFWEFTALNAGDVVTIGGTFVCDAQTTNYNIAESKFTWTGENWEVYKEPVVYTTYNVNKLGIANGCTADVVYAYVTDGDKLPGGDWANAFSFEAGSGAGMKLNDVEISGWEIKQPGDFYIKLSAAAVAGDTLTIDGAYYNEATAKRFVFNNCTVTFNGTGWEAPSVEPEEPEQPPVEGYTTYDIGALVLHVNSTVGGASGNNNQLYLTRADEEALPILSWEYAFAVGEGGYFKINDEVVTPNAIKSTGDGFFWEFTALNAGDVVTIGGTFVCDAQTTNYNIAESKFTWTGENWEVYKEPVVYTTYNVNKLGIANGCTADVVYAYVTDGDKLPGGDWANAFSFEAGSGAGMKLNDVEISGWEIKQPGDFYIKLSAAAVAGDTLTIDGAYYNEATAKRFVFNNCTVTFNGTGWEAPSVEPEEPEQPEIEYKTYEIGKVIIINSDSSASAVNFDPASGDKLEITDGTWAEKLTFLAGSGVGITLSGTQIAMNDIKIPNNLYVGLGTTAVAGDVLVIGGTFYNDNLAVKYVIEESTFTYDGTAWVSESSEEPEDPEQPEQPPVEGYTTYDLGALTFHVNSKPFGGAGTANHQLYLERVDGEALPFMSWDFLFTVGEDGYFKLNDQVVTPNAIKSTDAGFFWEFTPLSAGDTITIGGTFVCEDKAIKYVVSESKFTWNGTNWEAYREPVVYTTYELGQVILLNADSTDSMVYFDPASGEKLPVIDGTWAEKLTFLAGSGVGITLNGVQINMNDIKIPNTLYVGLGTVANEGDVLVIGGTFYNDNLAIKYVIEESTFTYTNQTWVSTLEVARANAKQEIDTYLADFAQSDYYAAQWEELITIVNTAKASIDVASESGLAAIVNQAKEDISKVETKEEVDVVLVTARNNAKMDLAGYKQEEDYKEAEWQVIQDAITAANAKINAATTEAEIQAAVAEAKAAIDAVKTAAELDAEQLKTWRDEAKATVQAYYDAIDFTKCSTEDNTKLAGYVAAALKAIEEETDKAKIDEIVAQFKANVDGVTGVEEDSGCGSVGVASGCLLGGLTMVAAAVALRKKKED